MIHGQKNIKLRFWSQCLEMLAQTT